MAYFFLLFKIKGGDGTWKLWELQFKPLKFPFLNSHPKSGGGTLFHNYATKIQHQKLTIIFEFCKVIVQNGSHLATRNLLLPFSLLPLYPMEETS